MLDQTWDAVMKQCTAYPQHLPTASSQTNATNHEREVSSWRWRKQQRSWALLASHAKGSFGWFLLTPRQALHKDAAALVPILQKSNWIKLSTTRRQKIHHCGLWAMPCELHTPCFQVAHEILSQVEKRNEHVKRCYSILITHEIPIFLHLSSGCPPPLFPNSHAGSAQCICTCPLGRQKAQNNLVIREDMVRYC